MPLSEASALRCANEIGCLFDDAEFKVSAVALPNYTLELKIARRDEDAAEKNWKCKTVRQSWDYPSTPLFNKDLRSAYAELKRQLRDEIATEVWKRTKTA